jgi:hypothetical protein
VGAVPKRAVDVFVAVDNRPQVLACIAPGQNSLQAANAIGLGKHQLIASGPGGTIIRGPGDPKTVEKTAQDNGIKLCFPPEPDFRMNKAPLTPFRGHDHKAHEHSGRGPHEHDAPDPPLDWGVTPPEFTIRWEAR